MGVAAMAYAASPIAIAAGVGVVVGYGLSGRLLPGLIELSESDSAAGRLVTAISTLHRMGVRFDITDDYVAAHADGPLLPSVVQTDTHPGFMTDWQPPLVVLFTQCEGMSVVHETVYENRLGFTEALVHMGADIVVHPQGIDSANRRVPRRALEQAQTPESRFNSTSSRLQNILEGNWQSCQEMATGRYGERVYATVVRPLMLPTGASTSNRVPLSRNWRFARESRCAIVGTDTRNARAISCVDKPPIVCNVSATCASSASAG